MRHFKHPAALLSFLAGFGAVTAQHQTLRMDDPQTVAQLPYELELRRVTIPAEIPTLHSYVAGQSGTEWVMLAGKTNGLHGLTGRNAFDPAYENREVWVIDPISGQSWSKSLLASPASGLTADVVDSLSAVNAQFLQHGDILYLVGGYGFLRSLNNHTTYATLTTLHLPGLIAWVKASPGSEAGTAADHIRQISNPFFKVTGGGLEKIGDEFQLIFGQNYEGAYRPFLNGIYTRQVRRFKLDSAFPTLTLSSGSLLATPVQEDFRRRDLNVLPIVEKSAQPPYGLVEKAMVLGGVFTPEGGVWTLPVIVSAGGVVEQMPTSQNGTLHQAVQQYHCAKLMLFQQISGEMHTVLFGGISLKYWDATKESYVTDEQAPFVNDVTAVVRNADGSMRQYRLPHLFPDIRASWDASKPLLFGTNAEFFRDPQVPLLTSKIIDLAAIGNPRRIGWIHGGIIADAPNRGITAASGHVFEVWLRPRLPESPQLEIINADRSGYWVRRQQQAFRADLHEVSSDLSNWEQTAAVELSSGALSEAFAPPAEHRFHRLRSALVSLPVESTVK